MNYKHPPHFLYLIRTTDYSFLKIGQSSKPYSRIASLGTSLYPKKKFLLVGLIKFQSNEDMDKTLSEQDFHTKRYFLEKRRDKALFWELYFKTEYKNHICFGKEWLKYESELEDKILNEFRQIATKANDTFVNVTLLTPTE